MSSRAETSRRALHLVALAACWAAGCGDDEGSSGSGGGGTTGTDAAASTSSGTGPGGTGSGGDGAGPSGTGGDVGSGGSGGDTGSGGNTAANPHPLHPSLDLDTLPGKGGAQTGPYQPPALPTTTSRVQITTTGTQAGADLLAACQTPGTAVSVPDAAGRIGLLDFGNVEDCDVTLGGAVIADHVYVGHLPGPTVAPTHRLRIRGGQIGAIIVDPGSTDIVFEGVTVDNAVRPPGERSGVGIHLIGDPSSFVDRFAFVGSVLRMVAIPAGPDLDGCAYLAGSARNVFFANDNIVTAGNRNSWGFRISGGDNFIIVDSSVRVSFHKMIRMNDGPVDYVYVKGGTWMRESTLTSGGMNINDSFAQLGDLGTDQVFIHDPELYLLSPEPVTFGASSGPGQAGRSWEARGITWHALDESVISAASLESAEGFCDPAATCDYGGDTHQYLYDASLAFPADPWRSLPGVAIDDPDQLPVAD
jgi:hypothetical protein